MCDRLLASNERSTEKSKTNLSATTTWWQAIASLLTQCDYDIAMSIWRDSAWLNKCGLILLSGIWKYVCITQKKVCWLAFPKNNIKWRKWSYLTAPSDKITCLYNLIDSIQQIRWLPEITLFKLATIRFSNIYDSFFAEFFITFKFASYLYLIIIL